MADGTANSGDNAFGSCAVSYRRVIGWVKGLGAWGALGGRGWGPKASSLSFGMDF